MIPRRKFLTGVAIGIPFATVAARAAEPLVITTRVCLLVVCAMLSLPPVDVALAADPQIKPPIRGLVSMGAYRFVGKGGDPVNTLEPLNAKAGIFSGLVIIATWKQLQPTPTSEIGENNVIDQALADVEAYNARNPAKPLAVKLRGVGRVRGAGVGHAARRCADPHRAQRQAACPRPILERSLSTGVVAVPGATCRQVRCAAADPRGLDHVLHVVYGRAVLPSE